MTNKFSAMRPRAAHISISSQAQDWWACLPVAYRPENLALQFPRVMNEIAARWNDASQVDQYLRSLLIDLERPQRQGFPPDVGLELMRVHGLGNKRPVHGAAGPTGSSCT